MFVCYQHHMKTTDQISMKISPEKKHYQQSSFFVRIRLLVFRERLLNTARWYIFTHFGSYICISIKTHRMFAKISPQTHLLTRTSQLNSGSQPNLDSGLHLDSLGGGQRFSILHNLKVPVL